MQIPLKHQRQVILFDPMWPFTNACHWPYSYVYIMGLEESSWIFMAHCNWMLSMKWNTALLEGCLPWDTNLNLHFAHCIQSARGLNLQATSIYWFVQIGRYEFIWVCTNVSVVEQKCVSLYFLQCHILVKFCVSLNYFISKTNIDDISS